MDAVDFRSCYLKNQPKKKEKKINLVLFHIPKIKMIGGNFWDHKWTYITFLKYNHIHMRHPVMYINMMEYLVHSIFFLRQLKFFMLTLWYDFFWSWLVKGRICSWFEFWLVSIPWMLYIFIRFWISLNTLISRFYSFIYFRLDFLSSQFILFGIHFFVCRRQRVQIFGPAFKILR